MGMIVVGFVSMISVGVFVVGVFVGVVVGIVAGIVVGIVVGVVVGGCRSE